MKQKICQFPGCTNPAHARGFCNTHYNQLWRTGAVKPIRRRDSRCHLSDQVFDLTRRLRVAERCYETVIGLSDRIRWQHEIREIASEIRTLNSKIARAR